MTSILVVEDDEVTRAALADLLDAMGYTVLSAATGAQAAEALERLQGQVDVLLCDVQLPDADGRELALHLGVRWPVPRFVLMSGHFMGATMPYADSDARYRWLSKPFTTAQLKAALRPAGE
ncbi:MAG TPA: response regulator [Anaerolineales bacterium]|nr:response regulator [Anaerolineales bacterium]